MCENKPQIYVTEDVQEDSRGYMRRWGGSMGFGVLHSGVD